MASFTQQKYDWYITRSGLDPQAPLGDHQAAYYVSKGFGSNASIRKPVSQMEEEWLISLGGSWADALMSQSKTPTVNEEENEHLFYATVATSP